MTLPTEQDVFLYIGGLREEFPEFELHMEKPWWLKVLLKIPCFKYLEDYNQAIGFKIYTCRSWDKLSPRRRLSILRHEREHFLWARKYSPFLIVLAYIFVFFPIYLAWFRAAFERAGYRESLRSRIEYYGNTPSEKENARETYLRVFTTWDYFKMWPYKRTILRWFEEDWATAEEELNAPEKWSAR